MYKLLITALLLSVTGLANAALIKIDLTDEDAGSLGKNETFQDLLEVTAWAGDDWDGVDQETIHRNKWGLGVKTDNKSISSDGGYDLEYLTFHALRGQIVEFGMSGLRNGETAHIDGQDVEDYNDAVEWEEFGSFDGKITKIDVSEFLQPYVNVVAMWGEDSSFRVKYATLSVVPEPGTLGLLVIGMAGLFLARRRIVNPA